MDSFEAHLVTDLAADIQADPGFYDNPGIPYYSSRDDLFSLSGSGNQSRNQWLAVAW